METGIDDRAKSAGGDGKSKGRGKGKEKGEQAREEPKTELDEDEWEDDDNFMTKNETEVEKEIDEEWAQSEVIEHEAFKEGFNLKKKLLGLQRQEEENPTVYGLQMADSVLADLVKKVLTVSCALVVLAVLAGIYDVHTGGDLQLSFITLMVSLVVPLCGYISAKNSSSSMACCFCGCNLCGALWTCFMIYVFSRSWGTLNALSNSRCEAEIGMEFSYYGCEHIPGGECENATDAGDCCSCLGDKWKQRSTGCPLGRETALEICGDSVPTCRDRVEASSVYFRGFTCCKCLRDLDDNPYVYFEKIVEREHMYIMIAQGLFLMETVLHCLAFWWGNSLRSRLSVPIVLMDPHAVMIEMAPQTSRQSLIPPGTAQPYMMRPSMTQPGTMQPGMMQPGTVKPPTLQPRASQLESMQPGHSPPSGTGQPDAAPQAATNGTSSHAVASERVDFSCGQVASALGASVRFGTIDSKLQHAFSVGK